MHRGGGQWNVLIARVNGGSPNLIDSRSFTTAEETLLDGWLDQHRAGSALMVLPASSIICRSCNLPDSDPIQMNQALELQAEAHIASVAPPHRIATAVLNAAQDETTRSGLMIAWPESTQISMPHLNRPILFTSDVVALASLMNGTRPENPLVWLDRADGSLAIAMSHANGAAFRCTREIADSNDSWQRNVGRAITETGLSVGHSDQFLDSMTQDTKEKMASLNGHPAALFLPSEILDSAASRLSGTNSDPDWWRTFGVAIGALLARSGPLQPLTKLQESLPKEKPSILRTMAVGLSRPRVAWAFGITAMLALLFGPMLLHGLRIMLLNMRFDDIQTQLNHVEKLRKKYDMYDQLGEDSWPMTKLLSDLATNTPEGIELDSIRITYNESLNISGLAIPHGEHSATELIALMQRNLEDTYIFSDTDLNWSEPNSFGHYEFTLNTNLSRPFQVASYENHRDFAAWTMQQRVDGQGPQSESEAARDASPPIDDDTSLAGSASTSTPQLVTSKNNIQDLDPEAFNETPVLTQRPGDTPVESDVRRTRDERRSAGSNSRGGLSTRREDRGGGMGALPASKDIPEPISEEQINAMTLPEVEATVSRVATARQHAILDAETKVRLKREFNLLITRMRELKSGR
ncbi:MAG: PilN domain-containing protein [Planctomycetota bacterium]|nr:PilN domain-containing protein [Planctomycetota bacterium]